MIEELHGIYYTVLMYKSAKYEMTPIHFSLNPFKLLCTSTFTITNSSFQVKAPILQTKPCTMCLLFLWKTIYNVRYIRVSWSPFLVVKCLSLYCALRLSIG